LIFPVIGIFFSFVHEFLPLFFTRHYFCKFTIPDICTGFEARAGFEKIGRFGIGAVSDYGLAAAGFGHCGSVGVSELSG
jgi:hypothetical protein